MKSWGQCPKAHEPGEGRSPGLFLGGSERGEERSLGLFLGGSEGGEDRSPGSGRYEYVGQCKRFGDRDVAFSVFSGD